MIIEAHIDSRPVHVSLAASHNIMYNRVYRMYTRPLYNTLMPKMLYDVASHIFASKHIAGIYKAI